MRSRSVLNYAVTVFAMAVTVTARWLTDPWLGSQLPVALLFGTVAFAVWYAGLGPAIAAAAFGYLASYGLLLHHRGELSLGSVEGVLALVVYALSCAAIIGLGQAMRIAQRRAEIGRRRSRCQQQRLEIQAAHHRLAEAEIRSLNEALRRRAEELQAVVDVLPVGIFLADDPRCTSIRANPAGAAMLGIGIGSNASKSGPGAERLPFRVVRDGANVAAEDLPMQRATRTGQAVHGEEYDIIHLDGTESRLLEYATPLFDERGQVRGCVGAFVDITARRRAEESRSRSEEQLRVITNAVPALISYIDFEYRYRLANDAYRTWFGLEPEDIRGRHVREVLGAAAWDAVRPHMQRALAGEVVNYEQELPYHRSGPRWVRATYTPDRDAAGRVRGFVVLVTDIGERRRAEEEVRQLNRLLEHRIEELQTIIDLSPVGIALAEDAECGSIRVNRALAEILQVRDDENAALGSLTGERPRYRLCRDGRELPLDQMPMRIAASQGVPVDDCELEVNRPDGTRRTVINSARPLFDRNGNVRGAISVATDITSRKQIEQKLRDDDRRKDEFLATLAHELRNPLAPISHSVDLMRLVGQEPVRREELLDVMRRQVNQLTRLIDDLLDVSRISRGKIQLRCETLDLTAIVDAAHETVRPAFDAAGHQLQISRAVECPRVEGDAARLIQVIANLLGNACKFTPEGGQIRLTLDRDGDQAVVRVCDSGIGIAPERQADIFEMFAQLDRSLERPHSGLGIGLTLAKSLVEMHGGSISVRSEGPNRGSEFEVRLPLARGGTGEAPPPADQAGGELDPKLRVLLVEDSKIVGETFAMLLTAMGHDVRLVHDGRAAIDQFPEYQPDVVFSDISMPGMNGYQVARCLRERYDLRSTMLVALTGYGQAEDRRQALQAGFDEHMVKPPEFEHLRDLFHSAAARRATQTL